MKYKINSHLLEEHNEKQFYYSKKGIKIYLHNLLNKRKSKRRELCLVDIVKAMYSLLNSKLLEQSFN